MPTNLVDHTIQCTLYAVCVLLFAFDRMSIGLIQLNAAENDKKRTRKKTASGYEQFSERLSVPKINIGPPALYFSCTNTQDEATSLKIQQINTHQTNDVDGKRTHTVTRHVNILYSILFIPMCRCVCVCLAHTCCKFINARVFVHLFINRTIFHFFEYIT